MLIITESSSQMMRRTAHFPRHKHKQFYVRNSENEVGKKVVFGPDTLGACQRYIKLKGE